MDFLKSTYKIFKAGFVNRIYMNAIACMCFGASLGIPNPIFRFIFMFAGVLMLAETWYQFGFNRATVINSLRSK